MEKNPEVLLQMLFQVHVQTTMHKPLCFHEFSAEDLKMNSNPKTVLESAVQLYKQLPCSKTYGSVDVNPHFWFSVFCNSIAKPTFQVPNGCCTSEQCPVKLFYECIYKVLTSNGSYTMKYFVLNEGKYIFIGKALEDDISNMDWNINDIKADCHKYVTDLLAEIKTVGSQADTNHIVGSFLKGISGVKICSNEGRASMQLDFHHLCLGFRNAKLPQSSLNQKVEDYIRSYYI